MRQHRFALTLGLIAAPALVGCTEEIVSPLDSAHAVRFDPAAATLTETGDHIVVFSNGVPGDFGSRVAALGGSVETVLGNIGIAVVSGLSTDDVAQLRSVRGVSAIGPDVVVGLTEPQGFTVRPATKAASPADPTTAALYPFQWNLPTIGADKAWAAGKLGSPGVTVAILDTGIDYLYPDLQGRVDLSRSVSFVEQDDAFVDAFFPGRHHVTDLNAHGTHVAGIVSSNALIAAGVTSRVTLMGVKVLNVFGTGFLSDVLAGIQYATDNGAHVINLSLGGAFDRRVNEETFKAVEQALFYALIRGVLVVAAAGNDAIDINGNGTIYENYCESFQVLCVTATGPTGFTPPATFTDVDAFAPYSNWGKYAVSVAAPGGNVAGGIIGGCSTTSLIFPECQTGLFVLEGSGTSQATPHASALAALLVEKYGRNPLIVRLLISSTADDRGPRGRDPYYGWGRINVEKALGLGRRGWW